MRPPFHLLKDKKAKSILHVDSILELQDEGRQCAMERSIWGVTISFLGGGGSR
jgi:hypothetical protein